MKTLAAIKNELFKDYIKLVSTDDLESTLDNPNVPVPFVCVAAVQNNNADALVEQLNNFFAHRKLKNKDFLAVGEDDLSQLHFLFNLIQISGGGKPSTTASVEVIKAVETETPVAKPVVATVVEKVEQPKAEIKAEVVKEEPKVVESPATEVIEATVVAETVEEPKVEEKSKPKSSADALAEALIQSAVSTADEDDEVPFGDEPVAASEGSAELIESLGIPKYSVIKFIKNEEITACIVDEKTVMYEDEQLSIVDATKRAFKKAGVTGMALGLANWNYEGTSLKALKDKNS